jgi:clan AA aspartic protease (TIGR02281 family)
MVEKTDGQIEFARIATIVIAGALGSLLTFGSLAALRPAILKPAVQRAQGYSPPQPVGKVDGIYRSLRVRRGDDLSFHLIASINKVSVRMLVDTGANITVLSRDDAARAGLPSGDSSGHIDVVGINSTVSKFRRAGTYSIGLGPIGLVSVPVAVDDSGELKNSILGQDAICGIDRVTIQSDELEFLNTRPIAQGCTDESFAGDTKSR